MERQTTIGTITYSKEQLEQELNDLDFLRDAMIVLINEDAAKQSWDIPYTKDEVLKYAREMYQQLDYSEDFLSKVFSNG